MSDREASGGDRSAERLLALLEATGNLVSTATMDGRLTWLNRGGRMLAGWDADEPLAGKRIADLHPEWVVRKLEDEAIPAAIREGKWQGATAIRTRDGREVPVWQEIICHREPDGRAAYLSTIMSDISARVRAERALKESEERFSLFMDFLPASVFIKDARSRVLYANRFFREAFRIADYAGKWAYDFFDKATADGMLDDDRRVLAGETVINDKVVPHADGSVHSYRVYEFLIRREGQEPLIGGISIDVTEMKKIEEQLRQGQKMESLGTLAGGIAHDFNNLLTGIISAAELVADRVAAADGKGREYVGIILKAAEQAAELIRRLLSFSRKGPHGEEQVDLHAVIRDALSLLGRSIDRRIEHVVALSAAQHTLRGDRHQLQNMVMNLVINAAHAMPEGGQVRLATVLVQLDPAYCSASSFALAPGAHLELTVSDTGCGIAPEALGRIFDPFYTTKPGGTGLGLSAVYRTVLDHRGEITVTSTPGAGSVFRMRFPVAEELPVAVAGTAVPELGNGTILLIDDEPLVRETGQALLEQLGYTVLTAADGPAGIALFRKRHREIDLVILDMIMPKLGGCQVFAALRKIAPECRIAISSGYSAGDDLEQLLAAGAAGLIAKPYSHRELGKMVAGMMRGRVT